VRKNADYSHITVKTLRQKKHKPIDDAVEILHHRLVGDDPEKLSDLEKIRAVTM
jgi:hypothetical protein